MSTPPPHQAEPQARDAVIPAGAVTLAGDLRVPPHPVGLVLFAHGSGSSRRSPRNRAVAGVLHGAGIGTLLFDLLTDLEGGDRRKVFDIELLAERLLAATRWVTAQPDLVRLPLGYFGASTGAAAALAAAAERPEVAAVVSRGGRPDLAEPWLERVRAPTLLLVGELDEAVLALNHRALARLAGPKQLVVIPGATHLFEEPGTLEAVARAARDWFAHHFRPEADPPTHELLEHTGEVQLRLRAATLPELFAEAGRALRELQLPDLDPTAPRSERVLTVKAPDRPALLIEWLNELIYLGERDRWVATEFRGDEVSETEARLNARGVTLAEAPCAVKAATLHGTRLEEHGGDWEAEVLLDV